MALEVLLASSAGFCFGVRRALKRAERARGEAAGRVVTLGPLIHNPQEVERLRAEGVEPVEEGQVAAGDTVVVRSHGIAKQQLRRLQEQACVQDATCPYVRSCQNLAARMAGEGYAVVLVGEPGHPETESVISHVPPAAAADGGQARRAVVVADPGELDRAGLQHVRRVAVLAQTTIPRQLLKQVAAACLDRFVEVRVFDTICEATVQRQEEARQLAGQADVVVVVGGRQSSNTRRLAEICHQLQPRTHHVERAEELSADWLQGAQRVAVTAGASTPERVIDQVLRRLRELDP
jgi:4-hydroxy-3-methylbut-2-enyl diphosphate reductase